MRLFIAEKPSLGRGIAQYLTGDAEDHKTHIIKGNDVVTWCFGHMLEMAPPEHYNADYGNWSFDHLPIVPQEWQLIPRDDATKQISVIRDLLQACTSVVNAGDPDREGQLLVDELLEHFGNRKPVKRIWLAALDEGSVRKALANLADNGNYQNLKASAEARQRGDWLVGMNLTRAYTLAGRESGHTGALHIGRVQTPTLALVVNRDLVIDNFKAKDFYSVSAKVKAQGGSFVARWKPAASTPMDEQGRVLDRAIAAAVNTKIAGGSGRVVTFEAKDKKQAAPLPFSLLTLQATANKRYGFGAQEVLDLAQALYEAKLTTYPRTACAFLPESQHGEASRVLKGLPSEYAAIVNQAATSLKSAAWNDAKVAAAAHHGIIPTGHQAQLKGKEAQLFDLIVRAYVAQFYPAYTFKETNITLDLVGETFVTTGKMPIAPGWKVIYGSEIDNQDESPDSDADDTSGQTLPTLENGQAVSCESTEVVTKKTSKPAKFTEGTLLTAMTNIHELENDPELKKRLRENAGIGTDATRAGIIESLKKRGYIEEKGKQIISTSTGRMLIKALPDAVKSPGLTGLFEQLLDAIAEGKITVEQFTAKQTEYVAKYVNVAMGTKISPAAAALKKRQQSWRKPTAKKVKAEKQA